MVAISLEPFINIKSYPYLYQVYIREALAIVAWVAMVAEATAMLVSTL